MGYVLPWFTPCQLFFFSVGLYQKAGVSAKHCDLSQLEEIISMVCSKVKEVMLQNVRVACVQR